MNRRLALPLLLAAAVTGAVVAVAVIGAAPARPPAPSVAVGTAQVRRTDLATTMLTSGTLDYAPSPPVLNQLPGTYTQLPAPGQVIGAGRQLYRVDDQPVVLMFGRTPAWRPFFAGMTSGPDVRELQAGLIALGYGAGLLSAPDGEYGNATSYAVERWQQAQGLPVTGQISLGQIAFLPAAIRVGALNVAAGQPAAPGAAPFAVTTLRRIVTVPVSPQLPAVTAGEQVSIILPSQATTPGRITAVGPVPPGAGTGGTGAGQPGQGQSGAGQSGADQSGGGQSGASLQLTVTPDRHRDTGTGTAVPVQVSLTVQSAQNVLAVPVTALLALAGGGYGVEIVTPSGGRQLVGVTTGLFAGGLVEVSGQGITAGTRVVVSQ